MYYPPVSAFMHTSFHLSQTVYTCMLFCSLLLVSCKIGFLEPSSLSFLSSPQINLILHSFYTVCTCVHHCVQLFATAWTVARQGHLSMQFPRQECWSGLPFPSPRDIPHPGIEPRSPALQADSLPAEQWGSPIQYVVYSIHYIYTYIHMSTYCLDFKLLQVRNIDFIFVRS